MNPDFQRLEIELVHQKMLEWMVQLPDFHVFVERAIGHRPGLALESLGMNENQPAAAMADIRGAAPLRLLMVEEAFQVPLTPAQRQAKQKKRKKDRKSARKARK